MVAAISRPIMLMQTVSYNHFNSVSELINVDNNLKVEFTYGPDDQRRKAEYFVGDIQEEWALEKTRYYIGAYEKQVDATNIETEVHYISAGGMLVAMYVIENGIGQYYYPHQDHLGSIIHITDESAEIVYTQSFDAWGRTRNADDLSYENIAERPNWLWRGFTGHEHLDEFGLINMNGRLYDPEIGRMLSPDNFVQSPDYTQSYNRYSYVWNNPLKYTDPDGEWVHLVIGAVVGGAINWALNGAEFSWEGLGYFAVGAVAGALSAGVGAGVSAGLAGGSFVAGFTGTATISSTGFAAGFAVGAAGGAVNGMIVGTGNSLLKGNNFDDALAKGVVSAGTQALVGGLSYGIAMGVRSLKNGGGFFEHGTYSKTVVKQNISPGEQKGAQNCLAANGQQMAKAKGIDLDQELIRADLGGNPDLDGLDINEFGEYYGIKTNSHYGARAPGGYTEDDIYRAVKDGQAVMATTTNESTNQIGHSVALRKVTRSAYIFKNSIPTTSFKYQVMNPEFGTFEKLIFLPEKHILMYWQPY
jgi:RHS repeat-associated protein